MANNYEDRSLALDMIDGCAMVVDRPTAIKGIREVCRYFGGQILYIPMSKTTGKTTEELGGILRDTVGDYAGDRMLKKLMALFGGRQVYIPMEQRAFHHMIVREIYDRYDGTGESRGALCREYHMSANTVYRFYREALDEKIQGKFEFEEEA
jgi:Mor family transcriptional regulator